jgi:hypothetical protein
MIPKKIPVIVGLSVIVRISVEEVLTHTDLLASYLTTSLPFCLCAGRGFCPERSGTPSRHGCRSKEPTDSGFADDLHPEDSGR